MSLLHSFYCWGSVGTILVSTAFFLIFGIDSWKWLAVILVLIPAINIYNFATCPIEHLVEEGQGLSPRALFRMPMFWIAIVLMICSGASELSMAQWASAYAESALGLSKTAGDLGGSIGPAIVGGVAESAGSNIRIGMAIGLIFPVVMVAGLILFNRKKKKNV